MNKTLPPQVQKEMDELHELLQRLGGFGGVTIRVTDYRTYTVTLQIERRIVVDCQGSGSISKRAG